MVLNPVFSFEKKKKNIGKPFTVKSKMFAVIMRTNSIDNQEN